MRTFTDPITGDQLSLGEHVAWQAQKVFRRWSTMIVIQIICFVWLILGDANARNWWNYTWSDLAIVVESVTMLALFAQTRRDAVVMRDTREIARKVQLLEEKHDEADAKRDLILAHLEQAAEVRAEVKAALDAKEN